MWEKCQFGNLAGIKMWKLKPAPWHIRVMSKIFKVYLILAMKTQCITAIREAIAP